jgi:DNA transposition AAA+ family ATPase
MDTPTTTTIPSLKIPGDTVNRATADLPDDQRSLIRRLHAHGLEHGLGLKELGEFVRYDSSTLWRIFNGKYEGGNIAKVCDEIAAAFKLWDTRAQGKKMPFIETSLSRKLWSYYDACLEFQRIGFVIGSSQIGKTVNSLKYQAEHNHGSTIYVRMPTGGSMTMFLSTLARALRIPTQQKEKELIHRIISSFDDRMMLLVDEAHQCCLRRSITIGGRTIEFIRELFDASGCAVVFLGTDVFKDEMETGHLSGLLTQIKRRRMPLLHLPDAPTKADLNTFAKAYGLAPADGPALTLQTDMIRDEALGMWLTLLRMASKHAAKRQEPMAWKHVLAAAAFLKTMESSN